MAQLKKLVDKNESNVIVECPLSDNEISERIKDYYSLSKVEFAKKNRYLLFREVILKIDDKEYKILVNYCINPFCKWFGLEQKKYINIKSKPSRYKLAGNFYKKNLYCNDVDDNTDGIVIKSETKSLSNWSIAEEIKRLIDINTIIPVEPKYTFHYQKCPNLKLQPFDTPKTFYRRGKSSSNSQKYQCKKCKKITNVLPQQEESFTYHQKRNDILPMFMKLILNRTPVTRTMEILNIGASTYYNKIEWLHKKSLEFLERHETKALKRKNFNSLWLSTDKFVYYLNNIKKKGYADSYIDKENPNFMTQIIATVDNYSRYVFRTDLAYDYSVTVADVLEDIEKLKENNLYEFEQKIARYRYSSYKPQSKTDGIDLSDLILRDNYVDGLHIKSTYTAYAQYWLIKNMLNVNKINYVCDEDYSLINSILRVYTNEIKEKRVNIFTYKIDKNLSKKDAYKKYNESIEDLKILREKYGRAEDSIIDTAINKLENDLMYNNLYKKIMKDGKNYTIKTDTQIKHPHPYMDEGIRYVNCLTDLSHLSNYDLAKKLYKVNMRSINSYFNQIRRRISILERPLVSARNEGKSYIYSNFNPRYAHYMLTILRTYLNFCHTFKYKSKNVTPAMLLGIADKPFDVKDIIYFK